MGDMIHSTCNRILHEIFWLREDGLHSDPGKAGNLLERLAKSSRLVDNGFISLDWLRIGKYSATCIIKW